MLLSFYAHSVGGEACVILILYSGARLCDNSNGSLKSANVREFCNGLVIQLTEISRRIAKF